MNKQHTDKMRLITWLNYTLWDLILIQERDDASEQSAKKKRGSSACWVMKYVVNAE